MALDRSGVRPPDAGHRESRSAGVASVGPAGPRPVTARVRGPGGACALSSRRRRRTSSMPGLHASGAPGCQRTVGARFSTLMRPLLLEDPPPAVGPFARARPSSPPPGPPRRRRRVRAVAPGRPPVARRLGLPAHRTRHGSSSGSSSSGSPGGFRCPRTPLWRIRTKLIVSYLFIALVPVVLLTLFMRWPASCSSASPLARRDRGDRPRRGRAAGDRAVGAPGSPPETPKRRAPPREARPARAAHPALAWTLLRRGACGRVRRRSERAAVLVEGPASRPRAPRLRRPAVPDALRACGRGRRRARARGAGRRGLLRGPRAPHRHPRPPAARDAVERGDETKGGPCERGRAWPSRRAGSASRAARLGLRLRGPAREDELGDRERSAFEACPRLPVRARSLVSASRHQVPATRAVERAEY